MGTTHATRERGYMYSEETDDIPLEIALLYEQIYNNRSKQDSEFYRSLCKRKNLRVLDAGCGTGRISRLLASDGAIVFGIDRSPTMIEAAKYFAKQERLRTASFAQVDLRKMNGIGPFDVAVMPFRTFAHMLTLEDQLECLLGLRAALKPSGLLVFDLFNPNVSAMSSADFFQQKETAFETAHGTLRRSVQCELVDFTSQRQSLLLRTSLVGTNSDHYSEHRFEIRYFFQYELINLLRICSFEVNSFYGDFDLAPFTWVSPQQIVLARRVSLPADR